MPGTIAERASEGRTRTPRLTVPPDDGPVVPMPVAETVRLDRNQARAFMTRHHGLVGPIPDTPATTAVQAALRRLRMIQLDPLDRIGTNADLVAMARVDGLRRGDVYDALLPDHAFEHFAKERCILPAQAFPYYAAEAARRPWWRLPQRFRQIDDDVLEAVQAAVAERGPLTSAEVDDHGHVVPADYHGWKSTSKAATMALKILCQRCRVVVAGRRGRHKLYDLPERALGEVAAGDTTVSFGEFAVAERVAAAGLMSSMAGIWWSTIADERKGSVPQQLVDQGRAAWVAIEGFRSPFLAPVDATRPEAVATAGVDDRDDDPMRILGPLDPLLWDRKLVAAVFGFDYVWEVYKPAEKRRWGYYVCPLLHRGQLVGRVEGHVDGDGGLVIDTLWREPGAPFDEAAWERCRERHATQIAG